MKTEPILQELEAVKDRLASEAHGDTRRFLDQMDSWLVTHPHAGSVVNSPEELQARLRASEAAEPPPPRGKPCLVHDPLIAEIHRAREALYRESQAEPLVLKDEPLRKRHGDFPMTKLSLPLTEEKVHALKVGNEVLISGGVFTRRPAQNKG